MAPRPSGCARVCSSAAFWARKLRRDAPEAVIELLTIDFEPAEAPGGAVVLSFAGGGDLRVEVECIDAALADVSAPWPAKRAPAHKDG